MPAAPSASHSGSALLDAMHVLPGMEASVLPSPSVVPESLQVSAAAVPAASPVHRLLTTAGKTITRSISSGKLWQLARASDGWEEAYVAPERSKAKWRPAAGSLGHPGQKQR